MGKKTNRLATKHVYVVLACVGFALIVLVSSQSMYYDPIRELLQPFTRNIDGLLMLAAFVALVVYRKYLRIIKTDPFGIVPTHEKKSYELKRERMDWLWILLPFFVLLWVLLVLIRGYYSL